MKPTKLIMPAWMRLLYNYHIKHNMLGLAKVANMSYGCAYDNIVFLSKLGLLNYVKSGRENDITLTPQGEVVKYAICDIIETVGKEHMEVKRR